MSAASLTGAHAVSLSVIAKNGPVCPSSRRSVRLRTQRVALERSSKLSGAGQQARPSGGEGWTGRTRHVCRAAPEEGESTSSSSSSSSSSKSGSNDGHKADGSPDGKVDEAAPPTVAPAAEENQAPARPGPEAPSAVAAEMGGSDSPLSLGVGGNAAVPKMPKQTVDELRNFVFGFDTFFVTDQKPYEAGIYFSGNLRGDPAKAYAKLSSRMQERFGDTLRLFLLTNPQTEKPVAVVVPKEALETLPPAVPEWITAAAFGLTALLTVAFRNGAGVDLDTDLIPPLEEIVSAIVDGIPDSIALVSVLAAHEAGHWFAAKRHNASLSFPFFIPSWQLGSFGAITRITTNLPSRQALVEIGAAGPLAGGAVSLLLLLGGLALSGPGDEAIMLSSNVLHDSLLVGGLAKLALGERLLEDATVSLHPLVLTAWAGLLLNALNSIPFGELDGGRVASAMFGRKAAVRWTGVSVALLGIAGIFNDVALYWVVLAIVLQRGAPTPQYDELTPPDATGLGLGLGALLLGVLVMFPYPLAF